jgi:hypothetical protein
MSQFVDVSEKSDDGIKKSLDQIYKTFGIPIGYTVEQLTELVKNPSIMQVNQSLLNLLVAMNKLQKDESQKSNLDLAIEQFKTGNIDESLINGLNSNLLKLMPTQQLQTGSVFNLSDLKDFLRNSGIAETVITNVEQKISPPPLASPAAVAPVAVAPPAAPAPAAPAAAPSYMRPTVSSSQRGGEIVLMTMIAVGLLILVIAGNKDAISSTVSDILSCFSSKPSSGGKKSKRMQNKSKRHRKSRRQRKSKRRQ